MSLSGCNLVLVLAVLTATPTEQADLSQGVLLVDFYADWCGPCQRMMPVVEQLAVEGYPVRKINVDEHPHLAAKYGVSQLPTFLVLVDGQPAARHVGATSAERLRAMFRQASGRAKAASWQRSDNWSQAVSHSPISTLEHSNWKQRQQASSPEAQTIAEQFRVVEARSASDLIAATVRITVDDPNGQSHGSGTIVDARQKQALIVTCAHIFRDSGGKGKIKVDTFGPNSQSNLPGTLIYCDFDRDVALVAIPAQGTITIAPVAPPEKRLAVGEPVIAAGCSNGQAPTVIYSKVASLNRFLGPANVEVAGLPVEGRSGGGLFSLDYQLVGVCNAADPSENQGLFAAVDEVRKVLDLARLSFVYQRPAQKQNLQSPTPQDPPNVVAWTETDHASKAEIGGEAGLLPSRSAQPRLGNAQAELVQVATSASPTAQNSHAISRGTPDSQPSGNSLANSAASSQLEAIIILRAKDTPGAPSEIFVLERLPADFIHQLAQQVRRQAPPYLTGLQTAHGSNHRDGVLVGQLVPAGSEAVQSHSAIPLPPKEKRRKLLEFRAFPAQLKQPSK